MDSTFPTPRYFTLFDAYVGAPGFPFFAGYDYNGVIDKMGFFGNPDLPVHPEAQVLAGFTAVPLILMGGDVDPFCAGNQAPIPVAD